MYLPRNKNHRLAGCTKCVGTRHVPAVERSHKTLRGASASRTNHITWPSALDCKNHLLPSEEPAERPPVASAVTSRVETTERSRRDDGNRLPEQSHNSIAVAHRMVCKQRTWAPNLDCKNQILGFRKPAKSTRWPSCQLLLVNRNSSVSVHISPNTSVNSCPASNTRSTAFG